MLSVIGAEDEPTYGYRIVQRLDSSGFGWIKGETPYPILARLGKSGYMASHWGEGDGGPCTKNTVRQRAYVDSPTSVYGLETRNTVHSFPKGESPSSAPARWRDRNGER